MMNYLLGGARNFAVDRAVADNLGTVVAGLPQLIRSARTYRWQAQAAAARDGFEQLLDLGAGNPVTGETPWPKTAVYVDVDQIAAADLCQLASPARHVVSSDITAPEPLLTMIEERGLLDLDKPVTVLLTMVLHHLDDAGARHLLGTLAQRLATGSRLVVSSLISDALTDTQHCAIAAAYTATPRLYLRTARQTSEIVAIAGAALQPSGCRGLFATTLELPSPNRPYR